MTRLGFAAALVALSSGCNGPLMTPGENCNGCHSPNGGARTFSVAGTLYGRPDAPADEGLDGASVLVTDADGQQLTLTTNAAGNFYTRQPVAFPIRVEAHFGVGVQGMEPSAQNGQCNSCHSVPSTGSAEGRAFVSSQDVPPAR